MGNSMVAKIMVENGNFVMENSGRDWFHQLCDFVQCKSAVVAELRINSQKKIEIWFKETSGLEGRPNCVVLEHEFAEKFDTYSTALEHNCFPINWGKIATRFCEEHGIFGNEDLKIQPVSGKEAIREEEADKTLEESTAEKDLEVEEGVDMTVQQIEGKDLKQGNKNAIILADIEGKQIWARAFKVQQTDDVRVAIWTEGAAGVSREKMITKSQIESGSTALATIMSNYDIKYMERKTDGKMESIKKKVINSAYLELKGLLKEVEELEDPEMGFNVTEIHRFVLQELDAGAENSVGGIRKDVLEDHNLIGCTRKVLETILEDTGWNVNSLCKSLLQRNLMKTDKAKHRRQLTMTDGQRIYVFKRKVI